MKTITASQAMRIINAACSSWKDCLSTRWGKEIALQRQSIPIDNEFYKVMRIACTTKQHKLFDEIFGKDQTEFKVDDWVVFMPEVARKLQLYTDHWNDKFINPMQVSEIVGDTLYFHRNGGNRDTCFRHATPEEIAKATMLPEGTPCLVSDYDHDWSLRYADGKGRFYVNCKKSGNERASFNNVMKLETTQELPVNE